jgi:UDP-N-acetylglucosamine 3-dehydrogenase
VRCGAVGVGRMGRHHARVYAKDPTCEMVGVVASRCPRRCTAAAEPLLKAGVACLIEKPLAGDVETARRLKEVAERHGPCLMVGHIERFNP